MIWKAVITLGWVTFILARCTIRLNRVTKGLL